MGFIMMILMVIVLFVVLIIWKILAKRNTQENLNKVGNLIASKMFYGFVLILIIITFKYYVDSTH